MSLQYASRLPTDASGLPMQEYPSAKKALARYGSSATVSSVITLTDNTTVIEVTAVGGGGVSLRWIPATETAAVSPFASVIASGATANFDNVVAADTTRRFVVPIEVYGTSSIVGLNKQEGLYNRVAFITNSIPQSSVLVLEN